MRQCDGVGGWVRLKPRFCRCRCGCEMCRCKINDLMKEKTATSILFILSGPLALLAPLALLIPFSLTPLLSQLLSGSYIRSILLPCFAQASAFRGLPWCSPEIAGCLVSCFSRMCIRLGCNLILEY